MSAAQQSEERREVCKWCKRPGGMGACGHLVHATGQDYERCGRFFEPSIPTETREPEIPRDLKDRHADAMAYLERTKDEDTWGECSWELRGSEREIMALIERIARFETREKMLEDALREADALITLFVKGEYREVWADRPQQDAPSRRQIVFNWLMGEEDLTKPGGFWGGSDDVARVDRLLAALDSRAEAALAQARAALTKIAFIGKAPTDDIARAALAAQPGKATGQAAPSEPEPNPK